MALGYGDPYHPDPRAPGAVALPHDASRNVIDSSWTSFDPKRANEAAIFSHDTFGADIDRNDWVPSWHGGAGISGSGDDATWATNNPQQAALMAAGLAGGGGAVAAPSLTAKSNAALGSFNSLLQNTLRSYLQGGTDDTGVSNALASLKAMGQLHPDLNYSFSQALGGDGLNPEQLKRLQELAARLSVQQTVLPSNLA